MTKIRMRAATCREVLYDPLPMPDPQVGELSGRLSSSARNNVVGIFCHAVVTRIRSTFLQRGGLGKLANVPGEIRLWRQHCSLGKPRWCRQ